MEFSFPMFITNHAKSNRNCQKHKKVALAAEQPSNDIRHRGYAAFFCFCVVMDVLLHGKCYVGMAEDLRQGADILPTLHPERSERMAEGMIAAAFQFGLI